MTDTHSGHEKFLDLVDGPLELDLGAVVRVFHCDQDVEVLVEVFPVGLPSVHLLLKRTNILKAWFECSTQTPVLCCRKGTGFHFSSRLAQFLDCSQTAHKQTHIRLKVV